MFGSGYEVAKVTKLDGVEGTWRSPSSEGRRPDHMLSDHRQANCPSPIVEHSRDDETYRA